MHNTFFSKKECTIPANTFVDLKGILPSADIMWITMAESTTSGEPLSEENLLKTIEACNRALNLDATKNKILDFLKS